MACSFDEARALGTGWAALAAVEVSLAQALGSTLAVALCSLTDVPAFRTAAMDGWAVAGDGPWARLPGRVLAGMEPAPLVRGTAIEIATGAMLPEGAHAVLRREAGQVKGDDVFGDLRGSGDFLPVAGECRAGDELLGPGTQVTPPVVGLAATTGHDRLLVHPRPSVAIAVLGDELLGQGPPARGRVRDSLSPQLPGWVAGLGGAVVSVGRIPDSLDATVAALAVTGDVVVSTGGTAAGPVDHVHAALRAAGAELVVDGVAVRPGHPMVLARLSDGRPFVGLPGNPLSACLSLLTLLGPVLGALRGCPPGPLPTVRLAQDLEGRGHETRLVPVAFRDGCAVVVPHVGAAMLRGLATAAAVVVVPPHGAAAGEQVRLLDLPWQQSGM